jgi:hypothetical protein
MSLNKFEVTFKTEICLYFFDWSDLSHIFLVFSSEEIFLVFHYFLGLLQVYSLKFWQNPLML